MSGTFQELSRKSIFCMLSPVALPHGGEGENVKVTRPKHRFLKMYLENGVILSDETANVLAEAG